MVRCGAGAANGRTQSSARLPSRGRASRGSKVTPAPLDTICTNVERLVARKPSSWTPAREQTALADQAYARLKQDPRHLSLYFKKVGRFWSARVGAHHRALAVEADNRLVCLWITREIPGAASRVRPG